MPSSDQTPGPLRLTYSQLGERLGISADAARKRAERAGWDVVRDNKGRPFVLVGLTELDMLSSHVRTSSGRSLDGRGHPSDASGHHPDDVLRERGQQLELRLAAAETLVAELPQLRDKLTEAQEQVAEVRVRAATAEAQVTELRERMAREEARLQATIDHERAVAAELRQILARPWWRRWWPAGGS